MPPTDRLPRGYSFLLRNTGAHKHSDHLPCRLGLYEGRQVSKDVQKWVLEGGKKRKGNKQWKICRPKEWYFFETWRCKYLYFVHKNPEARRQTFCTHNLLFSFLCWLDTHATVSWWCARWCPPFLRMGEVGLAGAPRHLPVRELEGREARWVEEASVGGSPEAEETREAARGTWSR